MKTYKVKPEFVDKWTCEALDELIVDEAEIERLAHEWSMDVSELLGQVEIDPAYMAAAIELMDDEIREDLHASGEFDTEAQFLREYERRHLEKYGKAFEI